MSGYKPPPARFVIEPEDRPGLQVVMRRLSVGELLDLSGLADTYVAGTATKPQMEQMFALFSSQLVSWNILGDDDVPVPATADGVRSLAPDLFIDLVEYWTSGMMGAPKASATPSNDTSKLPPEVASLPTAPLSIVQAS